VIGSGGAGFAAAIAARGRGRSVVMIERATGGRYRREHRVRAPTVGGRHCGRPPTLFKFS
jgi:thioredoxin reductase